ncbi:MAG: PepSY-associated TM helix domain-containing protein [Verrucomicrobiae bacterium]|jgi:hypothetical protein|nr:PepSY-associated TM helix domain-containing protein [Verrucomicrobiae bacterium]
MNERAKKWIRLSHIYISLYSLILVLFFGVTGFMMNHPESFGFGEVRIEQFDARMPVGLCVGGDRLALVEFLRKTYGIGGLVQTYEIEADRIRVSFAAAGRRAEVGIDPASGKTHIRLETKGLAAILSAVHAGEHTGRLGRRVIDVAAVSLILVSLSGLALWGTLAIRRETGIAWLLAGFVIAAVVVAGLLF